MVNTYSVTISVVQGNDKEYIIKDKSGITIGRIFIIEMTNENRYCSFRIKFYRTAREGYELLKDSLNLLLLSLFRNNNIFKANAVIDENTNVRAFNDLGFELEGVITNSIICNNISKNELLFGIDRDTFYELQRERNLSIKGNRVELRILSPENADEILQYYIRNKEHLRKFEPARDDSFYSLEVQRKSLIEIYKQFLNGTSANFGIYKSNNLIGKLQISNIVMGVFRNAFVGYSIDEMEQGKGYMKEAMQLAIKYCFKDLELHRIEASTLTDNLRSQAVLRACGFKEVGVSEKYLFINGRWRDHTIFYKIKENK